MVVLFHECIDKAAESVNEKCFFYYYTSVLSLTDHLTTRAPPTAALTM